jgi:hypothetical protein
LVFDSDLGRIKRMPCSYPRRANLVGPPPTEVKHAARILNWHCSTPQAKPVRAPARLSEDLGRTAIKGDHEGFVNVHERFPSADGTVLLAARIRVPQAGAWVACLGHDGGAELFVDGRSVLYQPELINPAKMGRSRVTLDLSAGEHEIVVALDLCGGKGWGIYFHFDWPEGVTAGEMPDVLPLPV